MRLKLIVVLITSSILFFAYPLTHSLIPNRFITDYVAIARQMLLPVNGRIQKVMFVPHDQVKATLLGLIYNEQKSIYTSLFRLTDREIAYALIAARERGIAIKIIVDGGCLLEKSEKVTMLEQQKIPVRYYKKSYAYMHNKILIFGRNFDQKPLLWTGSANATLSGLTRNEENVLITDNHELIKRHRENFESLWEKLSHEATRDEMIEREMTCYISHED